MESAYTSGLHAITLGMREQALSQSMHISAEPVHAINLCMREQALSQSMPIQAEPLLAHISHTRADVQKNSIAHANLDLQSSSYMLVLQC